MVTSALMLSDERAYSYSSQSDLLNNSPTLPSFFWNPNTPDHQKNLCEQYKCVSTPKTQDLIDFLQSQIHKLSQKKPHIQAPWPTVLIVDQPSYLAPVSLVTRSAWTNVLIKDKNNINNDEFYPTKHLRLTPDQLIIKPFDRFINKNHLDLKAPTKPWFNAHRRWLNRSLPHCRFYPHKQAPLGVLISSCQGSPIQSYSTEVVAIEPILLISKQGVQTYSHSELQAATMRALADYHLALPAFKSQIPLAQTFHFLTSDHNGQRKNGHAPVLKTSVKIDYDLFEKDYNILLSPEIIALMATIDDLITATQLRQSPFPSVMDFLPFQQSSEAQSLTTYLLGSKVFHDQKEAITQWLYDTEKITNKDQALTPQTLLHVSSYLGYQLPFHFMFELQTQLISHYDEFGFDQIIETLNFKKLAKIGFGIPEIIDSDDIEKLTLEIQRYFQFIRIISSSSRTSSLREVLGGINELLEEFDIITPIPSASLSATLKGPDITQIYHITHLHNQSLNLSFDPDFYLILSIIESLLAHHTIFHNHELATHLSDFLYSYSKEAMTLTDTISSAIKEQALPDFKTRLHQLLPYASHHSDLIFSQTNLLLLVGLYYDQLNTQFLAQIEEQLSDFYNETPLGLLGHDIDFDQLADQHFHLKGRLAFPKPISSRIQKILEYITKPYEEGLTTFLNFSDYAAYLSSLLHHHKTLLADKHLSLVSQHYYLYSLDLRQDEITTHYLRQVGGSSRDYVEYLLSQIPSVGDRLSCRQQIFFTFHTSLTKDILPIIYDGKQYSNCWRALNILIEDQRHGT